MERPNSDPWPSTAPEMSPAVGTASCPFPLPQPFQIIRPELHHANALAPMLAPKIGAPNIIALHMRELTLNCIGLPFPAFIEQAAGHRPEPVAGPLCPVIAKPTPRGINGVVRDRPIVRPHAREQQP